MKSSSKKVATGRLLRSRKQRKNAPSEPEKRGINTSGLAVLPNELLLEIVSYLPSLPALSGNHEYKDAMAYMKQRDLFLALSMSCRHLRRFFRPYVWRRLEVTSGMCIRQTTLHRGSGKEGDVAYATELVRQLEVVTIRDPSLAEYVQIVNFEVTDFSINSVLVELGRCFSLFPNLHTVKLDMHNSIRRWDMVTPNPFQKHIYPSIRHVILAPRAYPLLLSCPNVKSVHCISDAYSTSTELSKYLHKSPCIESVGYGFRLSALEGAVKALPNVRQLIIRCNMRWHYGDGAFSGSDSDIETALDSLVLLQQLQEVRLEMSHCCFGQTRDNIIKKVILQLQKLHERDGGNKRIIVHDVFLFSPSSLSYISIPPAKTPAL